MSVVDLRPQALYRFWDHDDRLLYVGISVKPWERWKQHRSDKPWWTEVAKVTVEAFASREEVLNAESAAIKTEAPLYNIAGRAAPEDGPSVADWDGVHTPLSLCRGEWLYCSCRVPGEGDLPGDYVLDGRGCELYDLIEEGVVFMPEEFSIHVIGAVLGEHFLTDKHLSRDGKMVGSAEIAAMFGISRQRAYQLTSRPDFPEPMVSLKAGAVWVTADVIAWAEQRRRTWRDPDEG